MTYEFKTVGLIGKYANVQIKDNLLTLVEYLRQRDLKVAVDMGTIDGLGERIPNTEALPRAELGAQCDLIIVMGGDGTMLNAARSLVKYNVPLIGINLGHLGFLTDISWGLFAGKLDDILAGQYTVEERLLLNVEVVRAGATLSESIAFNDVVLHKWEEARMLEFLTTINGRFVNSQRSDGLIVATPTGSTAYALSGGGPILNPCVDAICLVPVCPHTLSLRPIVVGGDSQIELTISEFGHGSAQVTCDGQINLGVTTGDKIRISRHPHKVTLLHPSDYDYYEILRTKLLWGARI